MQGIKRYSTVKTFVSDDKEFWLADVIHAESIEQAESFCNPDFDEYVVGEITNETEELQGGIKPH